MTAEPSGGSSSPIPGHPEVFSFLERTFIHVPMIGPHREADLWRRGFTDWSRFRGDHATGIGSCRLGRHE